MDKIDEEKGTWKLTLHMPAAPDNIVQADLLLPAQPDAFEGVPFGRRQLLPGKKVANVRDVSSTRPELQETVI